MEVSGTSSPVPKKKVRGPNWTHAEEMKLYAEISSRPIFRKKLKISVEVGWRAGPGKGVARGHRCVECVSLFV